MQYREGFIEIQEGSSTVNGFNTDWVGNVFPGDLFIVSGDRVSYEIASVVSDTELTLTAPYPDEIDEATEYTIHQSRTANKNYPFPEKGDVETATIVKRAIKQIDDDDYLDNNDLAQNGGTVPEVDQTNTFTALNRIFRDGSALEIMHPDIDGRNWTLRNDPIGEFETPDNLSSDTTHGLRYRLVGGTGINNQKLFAFTRFDSIPLFTIEAEGGTVVGDPTDGFRGRGALNAEELYEDGRRVVESDSNSDGEFTRFADGTAICAKQLELDTGITGNNTISDTPVPLMGDQFAGLSARSSFNLEAKAIPTMVIMIDENTWRIRQTDNSKAVSGTQTATLFAKGRWF